MPSYATVLDDFEHEAAEFRALITSVPFDRWESPTPAPGWTVRHQLAHLAFVFGLAADSASNSERMAAAMEAVKGMGFDAVVQAKTAAVAQQDPSAVLDDWDTALARSVAALRSREGTDEVPWLAGNIPVPVLARAGMLELFAHGQDVADGLGLEPTRSDRIEHLIHFVHRTRDFGYLARNLQPPAEQFRFEVVLPSGRPVSVGPDDSDELVRGDAVELCLIAARRRHPADTSIEAKGTRATEWLSIAQAYRGPAGQGRRPGQFQHADR